jgi:hypothetical protein
MNNQKETAYEKKQGISRKKVVMVMAMLMAVFGTGTYLYFSGNARGFLEQGSAIVLKSFEDIFVPSATGTITSEIDLASSNTLDVANKEPSGTSSPKNGILEKKQNGHTSSSQDPKTNVAITSNQTIKHNDHDTGLAMGSVPGVALPSSSFIAENSLSDTLNIATASNLPGALNTIDAAKPSDCSFPGSVPADISHRVILNEIAWMGSPSSTGETASTAANREWVELKNISNDAISLDGWRILDSGGEIKISFGSGDTIAANGLYLLSRGGSAVAGISTDKAYTGILSNVGDKIAVLDAACTVSDFLDASAKWPGGSNTTKQTLERTAGLGWQTSAMVGGTPRAENSPGMPIVSSSTEKYGVSIAVAGDGVGKVTVKPGNAICKTTCSNEYTAGTTITLTATPGSGVEFAGWSGGCSGASTCSFVLNGPVSVIADFHSNFENIAAISDMADIAGMMDTTDTADFTEATTAINTTDTATMINQTPSPPPSPLASVNHLVFAAIQIAGAAAGDDFVKIYNPTQAAIDISNWKLRKRSSTGTDSSLREFPKASEIAPGGYFTWASSANGFAASVGADASSTETLAANNSVALFDGNGAQVDAVAWGTGSNQYVEGLPYPESPTVNQVLQRKFADGAVIDTDNNANDFTL